MVLTELSIPDFPNYVINTSGVIKNKKTNCIVKDTDNSNGYRRVYLYKNGFRKKFFVHRLVGLVFLQNTDTSKKEIHHIDHNRANNDVSNLKWVTRSENELYKRSFIKKRTLKQQHIPGNIKPFIKDFYEL